jgi:hypothetical protein
MEHKTKIHWPKANIHWQLRISFSKYGVLRTRLSFVLNVATVGRCTMVYNRPKHLICPSCKGKIQMLDCDTNYQSKLILHKDWSKD